MAVNRKKRVSILGSSGSIGKQTIEVLKLLKDHFEISWLTVNSNVEFLEWQIEEFNPKGIVIRDREIYEEFRKSNIFNGKLLTGEEGLVEAASDPENDLVVSALVGFAGVTPTLAALRNGINVALANKETLVSAGHIITKAANENNSSIIAIDSEHSAILQCLAGESTDEVEKLILTASGGPFRETKQDDFVNLTVKQALDHPNWSMGNKITIDSATLMNKGFEIIEAYWLFDLDYTQIDVLVHPQSIVHSMVQFVDGSVKAQLGLPDMRIPISYALTYPRRMKFDFPRMDLTALNDLTFHKPDYNRFPCLGLAFEALKSAGSAPAVANAANEIAVHAFLKEKIGFIDIPKIIESALFKIETIKDPSLEDIIEIDKKSREYSESFLKNL